MFDRFLARFRANIAELSSFDLEGVFDNTLAEVESLKERILEAVEVEKGEIKAEIDALTRAVAEKDDLLQRSRLRAARVHELAARLKDQLDGE